MTNRQIQLVGLLIAMILVVALGMSFWPTDQANQNKTDGQFPISSQIELGNSSRHTLPAMVLKHSQSYERTVIHTGTIESRRQTMVAFQRGGMLTELLVDAGERVSPKKLIAILDNRHLLGQKASLQAKLDQAKAVLAELNQGPRDESIESARNVVEDLKQQLKAQELRTDRSRDLVKSNSIAKQDYERELYAKRGLEARLKSAESQLLELETGTRKEKLLAQEATVKGIKADLQIVQYNLEDCRLEAPFGGMIVSRLTDPGSVVAAGTPVFELIDDQNLEVHVGIPPTTAETLEVGAEFDLQVGKHRLTARLRSVLPLIDPATRTCNAIMDIKLKDKEASVVLFAGQLARVSFAQKVDEPGFWIPTSALTEDHSGLWSCLAVDSSEVKNNQGIARKHNVEILFQREQQVYVRGTLKENSLLLSSGIHRIVPGQRVNVSVQPTGNDTDFTSKVVTSLE